MIFLESVTVDDIKEGCVSELNEKLSDLLDDVRPRSDIDVVAEIFIDLNRIIDKWAGIIKVKNDAEAAKIE